MSTTSTKRTDVPATADPGASGAGGGGAVRETRVLIVGAGVSGIAVAHYLRKAGIHDFEIVEAADEVGGTWRANTYPGCACDVPSLLYSFSFAQNPDWSQFFAPQPEIQDYVRRVAREEGLHGVVRFGVEATGAEWDEDAHRWIVDTTAGQYRAQYVVAATGPLNEPALPEIPGLEDFPGGVFHTARWDPSFDPRGQRVAVVGTGASAIQLVPKIQRELDQLVLFQRTPSWVLPRPDRRISKIEQLALRYVPGLQRLSRGILRVVLEGQQLGQRHPKVMQQAQKMGLWNLRRQVPDPELRAALTPSFTLGCKRMLMSNTYYKALSAPNATVVPHALREVRGSTLVGADGSEHEVDAIIFATGFHVTDPPVASAVRGRSGATLAEAWGDHPQAYLGTVAPDAPNAFIMVGPNLGNGHTSVFLPVEAQAGYIADAITTAAEAGVEAIEVRRDVHDQWNAAVQDGLKGTVWNVGGCSSYYLDKSGKNSSIYPWTTFDLDRRMRGFRLVDFHTARRGQALPAP
ncbi:MAG: NAD(P)/FAD-dependent oxidoreductase, partial [Solirubrobacteraceae bacterium]|nr:NAD(P)/FAD-dependent oxidoreductase [Solirubrobacteraceae bacterium]